VIERAVVLARGPQLEIAPELLAQGAASPDSFRPPRSAPTR
jgi:hypothetical protein